MNPYNLWGLQPGLGCRWGQKEWRGKERDGEGWKRGGGLCFLTISFHIIELYSIAIPSRLKHSAIKGKI